MRVKTGIVDGGSVGVGGGGGGGAAAAMVVLVRLNG